MKLRLIAAIGLIAACGTQEQHKDVAPVAQTQTTAVAAEDKATSSLPRYLVVRVPLDASGNEILESAESREVASKDGSIDSADIAHTAFESGKSVKVADELDASSSTESWGSYWYWNTHSYYGRGVNRGVWWGRNPYVNYYYGYGSYYNTYRYTYGTYYTYNRGCAYSYSYGCYNYHYYYY
jgi:hypothetical protein